MGLLEKISWRTRRWNYEITLLNVSLHNTHGCWGIEIGTAAINHNNKWNQYRWICRNINFISPIID